MSQQQVKGHVLKLENNPHTLDFLGDAILARGYTLVRATTIESALEATNRRLPDLVIVVDSPEREIDARHWLARQHTDPTGHLATVPLLILVDAEQMAEFAGQAIPGRVVILQLPINLRALEQHMEELIWPWGSLVLD